MQIINNGGWHFSFLKDPQSIKNKIMSYSHQEYNTDEFTNTDLIREKILKKLYKFIYSNSIYLLRFFFPCIGNNEKRFWLFLSIL